MLSILWYFDAIHYTVYCFYTAVRQCLSISNDIAASLPEVSQKKREKKTHSMHMSRICVRVTTDDNWKFNIWYRNRQSAIINASTYTHIKSSTFKRIYIYMLGRFDYAVEIVFKRRVSNNSLCLINKSSILKVHNLRSHFKCYIEERRKGSALADIFRWCAMVLGQILWWGLVLYV